MPVFEHMYFLFGVAVLGLLVSDLRDGVIVGEVFQVSLTGRIFLGRFYNQSYTLDDKFQVSTIS